MIMAPIGTELELDTVWLLWPAITLSSLVLISLIVLSIVICACCGTTKKDQDLYYSIDPNHPDYCPDCAYFAKGGGFDEPGGTPASVYGAEQQKESMYDDKHRAKPPSRPRWEPDTDRATEKSPRREHAPKPSKERAPKPEESSARTVHANPKDARYKTLFLAKSNVFSKALAGKAPGFVAGTAAGPPIGDTQMLAAQKNPAYRTMYEVKSNVFDLPGGGGRGQAGGRAPQQMSMAGPNESRMREAAKNPAYKTLFGAQSNVFDAAAPTRRAKAAGGGRGAVGALPASKVL